VVSLVAQEKPVGEIVRGLNNAIANRIGSVAERLGVDEVVTMTGGVAKNAGVVKAIERKLGRALYVPEEPQIIGALGAALFARERYFK
jgi:activator of 2-hydroxyglutaryl-CoA dehydratase